MVVEKKIVLGKNAVVVKKEVEVIEKVNMAVQEESKVQQIAMLLKQTLFSTLF